MKNISLLLTVLLLAFASGAQAKIRLPALFSDNMILQQRTEVAIWGHAGGRQVTVQVSWSDKTFSADVRNGQWSLTIPTPEGSCEPQTLTLRDADSEITLREVLIGEVWICSGQSNMEMSLRGFSQQPIANSLHTALEAPRYRNLIRILRVGSKESEKPCTNFRGRWEQATPVTALATSATAYYFATALADALHIPVGIITTSRSSSKIEAWMPQEVLAEKFGYDVTAINADPAIRGIAKCGLLYNGMLSPLFGFRARGFLWYQGESNRHNPELYPQLMQEMVAHWRGKWQDSRNEMPFIYVQIAQYAYDNNIRGFDVPGLVEAQLKALDQIPNSALVTTTDIGEQSCIHPSRKDVVGKRAAIEALRKAYGIDIPDGSGVRMQQVIFSGNKAIVTFDNAAYGLLPTAEKVTGFEIAGKDRIFRPAEAQIVRNKPVVELSSPSVPEPQAVRYAFYNYVACNLQNTLGFPAFPFRSDNWPLKAE